MPPLHEVSGHFQAAVDAGWYSNFGPVSRAFERDVEDHLLAFGEAVACANCTAGLTASLLALGATGPVLIPAFTFQATASAVFGAGLSAITGDIDPATGVLHRDAVTEAVRSGIGAVILVRPYGIWSDVSEISEICRRSCVPLIIDNAAGLGVAPELDARYGVHDAIEVFSLHATKPFGVGEGGLVRAPSSLVPQIRSALNFGFTPEGGQGRGLNGKMAELVAAVGLAARARLPVRLAERQSAAQRYAMLADRTGLEHFLHDAQASPWQCFAVKLPTGIPPGRVVEAALQESLQLRQYYAPLIGLPGASGASALSARTVCLPVYDGEDSSYTEDIWEIFERIVKAG